ncbi:MAG: hypothetical protein HXX17_14865 [Geobacteraceae bacterium]|nr:hypothetical protein [Geobacteraceae bacterium]
MKKQLVILSAAAMVAAAAVPALALENEFHGMFLTQGISSNLNNGTTGPVAVSQANLALDKTFVDQRARLQYIAKANDDLKLVTHFEFDGRWGDNSYSGGARNSGLALGADSTSIEVKSVYLDFNIPGAPVNAKVGMQGLNDAYKGVFVGNDAAGALLTTKLGAATVSTGWFRFDDARAAGQALGKTTRDFTLLDGSFAVSKDVKVGASYYYYFDDNAALSGTGTGIFAGNGKGEQQIHMLGVNGAATFGPATLDGFFLYQDGVIRNSAFTSKHLSAFAANVGAKVNVGPGAVKTSFLYTSGSDCKNANADGCVGKNSFISAQNETSSAYMESGVFSGANSILIFRGNSYRTSNTDQSIVSDPSNKGTGIAAAFVGYDGAINKLFFNTNAAFVANAKKQYTAGTYKNKSQYLGSEINAEVGYKLYDNLRASVQGAYVFLGPAFSHTDGTTYAKAPYLGRVILSYTF